MSWQVGTFTDTYLPTVNGVTYTVKAWRDRWSANGGSMDIVYPSADAYDPGEGEHPVASIAFPFYDGYRVGVPRIPEDLCDADIVHAHTPFSLGIAALRLVRRTEQPLIASYHTPAGEYTSYLAPVDPLARALSSISVRYERWFFDHADAVIAPTETAATYLNETLEIDTPVHVISNGVDLDLFEPSDGTAFRERHGLSNGPLIGYTGRHGYEKHLEDLIEAVANGDEDWSVVFAGHGPATDRLRERATALGVDATFLGFLERDELPAFYSALDVFAFPSPIETQGLVAMESIACGTPVVGVDTGALRETIDDGETGYRYEKGDIDGFTASIERALAHRDSLVEQCATARSELGVSRSIESLEGVYASVSE